MKCRPGCSSPGRPVLWGEAVLWRPVSGRACSPSALQKNPCTVRRLFQGRDPVPPILHKYLRRSPRIRPRAWAGPRGRSRSHTRGHPLPSEPATRNILCNRRLSRQNGRVRAAAGRRGLPCLEWRRPGRCPRTLKEGSTKWAMPSTGTVSRWVSA